MNMPYGYSNEYEEWYVPPAVLEDLEDKMGQAVFGDLVGGEVSAAVEALGKRELAFLLSGASSTKDRAYKNARDNLSRYLRGTRKPRADWKAKMTGITRAWRIKQIRDRGRLSVRAVVTLVTSKKPWTGPVSDVLSGRYLRQFVDAVEAGDAVGALQTLTESYG
ncbi:hypothetical protein ACWDT6_30240, partial [Nocardia grenadensis]